MLTAQYAKGLEMLGMNKQDSYSYLHSKIQQVVNANDLYDLGYYKARAQTEAVEIAYRRPLRGFVDVPEASESAGRVLSLIDAVVKVKYNQLRQQEQDRFDARFNAIKF